MTTGIHLLARAEGEYFFYMPYVALNSECSVPSAGYPKIQTAINRGCTNINLTASLYVENIVIQNLTVVITGQGPENTTLDGNFSGPVIVVKNNAEMTLEGVTIKNGVSNLFGGGISNHGISHINNTVVRDNVIKDGPGGGIASDGTLTVEDSWILDNTAEMVASGFPSGGGLYITGTTNDTIENIVENTEISGNDAFGYGGGIFIEDQPVNTIVRITNSQISNNVALHGGGIAIISERLVKITGSTINNNIAGDSGGGIHNNGPTVLEDSKVIDNNAGADPIAYQCGGGIFSETNWPHSLNLERTDISGNSSVFGGGVCIRENGYFSVYEGLFASNAALEEGGAFYGFSNTADRSPTIKNSTFYNNSAGIRGGAFSGINYNLEYVTLSMNNAPEGSTIYSRGNFATVNSIIAGTGSGNICQTVGTGEIVSYGYNIASDNSCDLIEAGDMPNTDPLLGPLQDNGGPTWTTALLVGSPAIDSAYTVNCYGIDQRGVIRPQGDGCDRGAYEYDGQ